jgi:hypothetical protein
MPMRPSGSPRSIAGHIVWHSNVGDSVANQAADEVDGTAVETSFTAEANRYVLRFAEAISLDAGQNSDITLRAIT